MTNLTSSTLPYQMGNAGDLLKHGVLAELVRWYQRQETPVRFLDLFGGEPIDDDVPHQVARRVAELQNTALYKAQSDISEGRYFGSGKLVQRLGERQQGAPVAVHAGDSDFQRQERLMESGLLPLHDAFPSIHSGLGPYDAYAALDRIASGTKTGDIVLIDPFNRFLPDKATDVVPKMTEIARMGSVMLFALNLDPFNEVGRRFDRLLEQHLSGALIMTVPPLRTSCVRGESQYYADVVLAGHGTGNYESCTTALRPRLDAFANRLAVTLGLSNRGACMLKPRLIGNPVNEAPADAGGIGPSHDQPRIDSASKSDSSQKTKESRRHTSRVMANAAYGVDGCPDGWFYVGLNSSGQICWGVVEGLEELLNSVGDQARVLIDIPIGLPDDGTDRQCDQAARKALGKPRSSSVFPVPGRALLDELDFGACTYREANRVSNEKFDKGVSQQTFAILPKIKQVDILLRNCPKAKRLLREVHPEVCFWALNGQKAMKSKKSKTDGFLERLDVLKRIRPTTPSEVRRMIHWAGGRGVAPDDILDALVSAITASRSPEAWQKLPANPKPDQYGLRMEIVYVDQTSVGGENVR